LASFGHMSPLLAAVLMPASSFLTLAIVFGGMRRDPSLKDTAMPGIAAPA
jgi:hypothetical protein